MENIQVEHDEILMTEAAVEHLRVLMKKQGRESDALRVFVTGGGCSGLQYGMAFEAEPHEDDLRFAFDNFKVFIDPMSIGYLSGATIDYSGDLMRGGLHIDNPNAVASCGCGNSFET